MANIKIEYSINLGWLSIQEAAFILFHKSIAMVRELISGGNTSWAVI